MSSKNSLDPIYCVLFFLLLCNLEGAIHYFHNLTFADPHFAASIDACQIKYAFHHITSALNALDQKITENMLVVDFFYDLSGIRFKRFSFLSFENYNCVQKFFLDFVGACCLNPFITLPHKLLNPKQI